jgi:hypothetical protein
MDFEEKEERSMARKIARRIERIKSLLYSLDARSCMGAFWAFKINFEKEFEEDLH